MVIDNQYFLLIPSHSANFNTCFYCGCIASDHDYAPPLQYLEFYLATKEPSEFLKIPSCNECYEHLKMCKAGSLDERKDFAKKRLAKKYDKALTIYEMWSKEELDGLDFSLRHSIAAGLQLGEEATNRLLFPGFKFEAAGLEHQVNYGPAQHFDVFGEQFTTFRDALDFASKAYRISKNTLKEYFADHDNSFEKAIIAIHKEVADKAFQKQLKTRCNQFAKQHKQAVIFVHKQVDRYLSEDEDMTIDEALTLLYETRVKPSLTR
ncbi:hypothetical protein E0Z06_13790 [Rheinheimera sp. D18]|uniref:hypothetical protein n=1 Tax=Rheinheimera sp. D18 TaxID=2545632 RepID=UPI0010520CE0|nr:hypothetical protein [Rheinheimera sp. D18]QBL10521.1 hypothetical protein E0Z06_13790 [Rheinheimera sp. D18]